MNISGSICRLSGIQCRMTSLDCSLLSNRSSCLRRRNELPRSKLRGIKRNLKSLAQLSPPHVSSGGPVLTSPGFPLKACGNDGLRKGNKFYAASCGEFTPKRLKFPAGKSPSGGHMVRHIKGGRRLGVSDRAQYHHPVKKLRIPRLKDLFQRIIRQRPAFAPTHDLQQLVIELGVNFADSRRAGEMGEASGRQNGDPLSLRIRDLSDQFSYLVATARRRNRVHPGIHVDRQDVDLGLGQKKIERHDLCVL